MNHSPAQIVRQLYLNADLAVEPGDSGDWPIYHSHLPDGPGVEDDALCVYDTAGVKDGRPGEFPLFHHGVQLRVRCKTFLLGWSKAESLALALAGVHRETLHLDESVYIIQNITQSTSVVPLGVETGTSRRDHFTVNFLVSLEEA